ncbi:exodeoxyribonuclease III [Alkanindiges illinoisensis]|uniref:Exodeoxyribonuclease III n=1 Tax=Alkanindiges illinoisensis TaxID=197183 RepID=A0A4Y7XFI1_9GAMM|nr:exodeoxyribonuclease III [Alkanindiges illinoisensis]TEU30546.1 exodeoxyribonuclease III [Alkanindiges illinoisensis]
MKIATWNVNSLNVRAPQVLEWLNAEAVDVLCVQETKIEDHKFPYDEFTNIGYQAVHLGQKTYNGVAIISKHPIEEVQFDIPNLEDIQKRVVAATICGIRIICVYIPNGQSVGSDKYLYKLQWLQALTAYLEQQLKQYPKLALLGDYNIAPEDRDVYDPERWQGSVLVSEPERVAFRQLQALGLHDSFRLFEQPEKLYSWWDYRMVAFRRNLGLRIDHILISSALVPAAKASWIDRAPRKLERPSDHTPVVLELDIG